MTEFTVKLAETDAELQAAQRLRYDVFVKELGGSGDLVDHSAGLERDRFDPYFDHLILTEKGRAEVVGVYRLLRGSQAQAAGGFYSEGEYDLTPLKNSGKQVLELGRSCIHKDYRGGLGVRALWDGLGE